MTKILSFQNPDVYNAAWNLLKVCIARSRRLKISGSKFSSYGYFSCSCCGNIFITPVTILDVQAADGVLVPGGFGDRGVEGKILATKYARENRIPFLGICLGMQIAVIEFARSVLVMKDANSTEFDPNTKNPCVIFMPEVYIFT